MEKILQVINLKAENLTHGDNYREGVGVKRA